MSAPFQPRARHKTLALTHPFALISRLFSDDYWAPSALTSFGGCCQPNYNPRDPAYAPTWARFVAYLHSVVGEIRDAYAPDHFWFDSGTYPSDGVDTHIELLVPSLRAANPEVVLHVRDGGIYHDYVEPNDHSEAVVDSILGLSYASSGDKFEVPGTLGEQWAYDPHATYKDAATVISELVNIAAKGCVLQRRRWCSALFQLRK